MTSETTRIDRWLWSIRLCKTRADATDLCRGGHVRINDKPAKPASSVKVGDRIEAYVHERKRILEVVRIIDKRVAAPTAIECYLDYSPPPPETGQDLDRVADRDRGSGRPTKRERRQIDKLRGRLR